MQQQQQYFMKEQTMYQYMKDNSAINHTDQRANNSVDVLADWFYIGNNCLLVDFGKVPFIYLIGECKHLTVI